MHSMDNKFKFNCHENLACFGRCCRDINIFLSPYDVLRLKKKLGLSSGEFLDRYGHRFTAGPTGFPLVFLEMLEEDNLNCPFVSAKGCQVYEERPWACRMAPVDLLGAGKYGFIFDRAKCHGLKEDREWTVSEWMQNQGVQIYEEVEAEFKDIPGRLKMTGREEMDRLIGELFFTACYNLDEFKKMVGEKEFQAAFGVSPEEAAKLQVDELALLRFGFRWLKELDVTKSSVV
ncbi:MAG: YkgJ family cysteine cluster protein [Bacillota bacterium]|jgi:Fe-S-cluster containining protein